MDAPLSQVYLRYVKCKHLRSGFKLRESSSVLTTITVTVQAPPKFGYISGCSV